MNPYDINDKRLKNDFKGMTFSVFKKSAAKKQLLNSLLNGNIDNSKIPINTGELWVQSFPLKPDTNSDFDAYLLYWPLYLYYKHLNQVDQANKYLTLAYEIIGPKQIDKYNNHSEKDTYPEFFYCRDIIKDYETSQIQ